MNRHIQILEENDWLCDCTGPCGSLFLLATKPHQAGCTDINDIIWRLCVRYHLLNSVIRSLEFPITHCVDSIDFCVDLVVVFILSL